MNINKVTIGLNENVDHDRSFYLDSIADFLYKNIFFDDAGYIDLIRESNIRGKIVIDFPDLLDRALCVGGVYTLGNIWLHFKTKNTEFWISQANSRLVYIYFPIDLVCYSLLNYIPVKNFFILNFFLGNINYKVNESGAIFGGVLLGYERPYHFLSDHFPLLHSLYKLYGNDFFYIKNGVYMVIPPFLAVLHRRVSEC